MSHLCRCQGVAAGSVLVSISTLCVRPGTRLKLPSFMRGPPWSQDFPATHRLQTERIALHLIIQKAQTRKFRGRSRVDVNRESCNKISRIQIVQSRANSYSRYILLPRVAYPVIPVTTGAHALIWFGGSRSSFCHPGQSSEMSFAEPTAGDLR